MIEVTDFKWKLHIQHNRCKVSKRARTALPKYLLIPVPVFAEWFE